MFEEVDIPGMKMVESIATMTTPAGEFKGAWFKDTEGNIISINSM